MLSSGYIALLVLFLCIIAHLYMQFRYEGTTEHIYSVRKTLNTLMILLFPISVLLVSAYILIIHLNKKAHIPAATISLLVLLAFSILTYHVITDVVSDLLHIKNNNYIVTTGKPLIKSVGHGFELTLNKYTFEIKLHRIYPAYGAPQLQRIKASEFIEIKHHGNRVLEINEKR